MLISYKRGQGSIVLRVKIRNSSVSTGAGLTGLTSASSGLIISTIADNEATATAYTVAGSTVETITTLGTFAAPTATKCRFKEVDATNHPGIYEIQIADARYAVSSAKSLLVSVSGATNAAQCDALVPLSDLDPYDSVRAGLTALPNAAANANGGLPILSSSGTTLAYTISTLTTYTGDTPQTGDSYAIVNSGTHGNAALKTLIDAVDNFVDTEIAALTTTIGVAGAGLTDLGGFSTTAKGQIQTEAEDAIVVHRLDELLNADSDIDGAAPPTVGSVFHELMSKTAGSFTFDQTTDSNEALRDRGDAAWITATGFSTLDAAGVRSAVGLASANLDTQLSAIDDYIDTEVGTISTNLSALITTVGVAGAGLTAADDAVIAAIAALNNLSASQVNAEVVDALATDTYAEPGQGAPAATTTLSAKINYLYKFLRNKVTQTATTQSIYADDGTTVDQKATLSDDGTTFTKGEVASGP